MNKKDSDLYYSNGVLKTVQRAYIRGWKKRNPNKVKEYSKKHYVNNADRRREATRQWKIENYEYVLEYNREYYHKNKDRIKLRRYQLSEERSKNNG